MRPFNADEAKAGKAVCDKAGKAVQVVFFDEHNDTYHIVHPTHTRGSWAKGRELGMADN